MADIKLTVEDGPAVDAARAATALSRELTREGVQVAPALKPTPPLSKGNGAIEIGSLVLSGALSVQIVRSIAQIVLGAMRRGLAGKIHVEDGDRKFEVANASRETEQALIAWLTSSKQDEDED
jgi:hypothetical protein